MSTMDWATRERALHRLTLRVYVKICAYIRERLLLMGLDPALAVCLRIGEEAAAELAADEAAAELPADEPVMCGDANDRSEVRHRVEKKIERMVTMFRKGDRLNFANASLASLLAYCLAFDDTPQFREPTS
jgi:hypothetical protein